MSLASFLAGLAGSADAPFPASDYSFLNKVWGYIRVAGNWTDINWGDGYLSKQGAIGGRPPISDNSYAIMAEVWPQIRVAANFGDINWASHGYAFTPAADPIPELAPQGAPPAPADLYPSQPAYPEPPAGFMDDLSRLLFGGAATPASSYLARPSPSSGSGSPYGGAEKPDPVVAAQKNNLLLYGGLGVLALGGLYLAMKGKRR